MVLTDLKALAGQLGIKGTSGLRKGDLVLAISSHQSSAAAAATRPAPRAVASGSPTVDGTESARSSGAVGSGSSVRPDDPTASPSRADGNGAVNGSSSDTASLDADLQQRTVRRRVAGRPEGAPAAGTPDTDRESATYSTAAGNTAAGNTAPGNGEAASATTGDRSANGAAPAAGSTIQSISADQGRISADQPRTSSEIQQSDDGAERRDRQSNDGEDGPRSSRRNRRNRRDRDVRGNDSQPDAQNGTEAATRDGQTPQNRDAPNRDTPNRDGQARDTQNRDGQNRDTQGRDGQTGRNNGRDGNRQDSSRQDSNRQDSNRQESNRQDRDADDQDGRRGRRFRDRNRRTRDRFADAPTDTEVRDDDVLVPVAGIVDVLDSYAFIRTSGYLSGPNDVYVSLSQIRKNGLRRGDAVTGAVRAPRDGEGSTTRQKFNALVRLDSVNGQDPELAKDRPEFTKLTPLYPNERLRLETESHILTTRIIDLVMPVGKGQRALIVSPPKAGKTSILQAVANAITTNNPEVHLMVVLVDERPEEVTDMQRSVKGEVIASTFDRPPADHTMVAELSIERAKRLVEMGRDVVVLLDSITRLGRAYNLAAPASGRILSGGVDSTALFPPKRFLGAARNIENGGSLTIFASALVETGSAGDTVIFEEFKGTGNAELKLDRRIADKRIFPAIDVDQSSTRKEDLLLSPDELAITVKLRRVLSALDSQQALELLLDRLRKTKSNVEFLMQVAKTTNGVGND
ncbi:MAG: transcription termination factor Rho [Nakamurella sp.]